MSLDQLKRRIERAEALLEGRGQQMVVQYGALRGLWRQVWTPGRIVVAGLGVGFLAGLSEPKAALASLAGKVGLLPKLVQLLGALAPLFSVLQPAISEVADAEARADGGDPAAPGPAEAATEVSES